MRHPSLLLPLTCLLPLAPAQPPLPTVTSVGSGCGTQPVALTMSPPLVGESCHFVARSAAAPSVTMLFWSFAATTPIALPGGCSAWLDLASTSMAAWGAPGADELIVAMPNDPHWLGAGLSAQAARLPSPGTPGFDTSNGLAFTPGARRGPFASLPSAPGPHLAGVAAMAPGAWHDLGVPLADPAHGLATGREYTSRMAWSRSLGGAFLTGESGHGYVNPNTGRYVDDVWFYDLAGHRWICVKPGSAVATLSLSLNQDQFEVDAQGELVPTAQLGHGYEFVAFDEHSQRFLMQPMPNTYWTSSMPQRLGWLPSATFPATQYRSPWLFDTVAGRWLREPSGALAPNFHVDARATVVHGASSGRFLYVDALPANQGRVWWFDPATLAWQDEATATPSPAISGNGVSCYDRNHDRLWLYAVDANLQQARLWQYDVATRTWTASTAPGTPPHTVVYTTGNRGLTYDERDDLLLLKVSGSGSAPPTFHPYDVASATWGAPITPPASLGVNWSWRSINACYASDYDVHVLHVAPTNSGTGRIVLFRH